jgi:hypothetical protein
MGTNFIEVNCETCGRHITLEEIASDYHVHHSLESKERAAMEAVADYVKGGTGIRFVLN